MTWYRGVIAIDAPIRLVGRAGNPLACLVVQSDIGALR